MSPDQELLLAAALLYLFECCIILHRRQLLFWSPGFSRFRIMHPENLPGSHAKAVFIAMPLPPLGEYLIAEPWPFALSPEGVASAPVQRIRRGVLGDVDYATFVPWSSVNDVRINGAVI
ncbi:MAG: hypothetical protein KDA33_11660, partial [Phycisphaerales bacterium]|nr:hypothetical protein [Phycisphaerales bacterium]